jgi:hypothetical protein
MEGKENARRIIEHGQNNILFVLVQVLKINSCIRHCESCSESLCAGLHVEAYKILAGLSPRVYRNNRLIDVELIVADMKLHLTTASVQQWACNALKNMASDEKYCVRMRIFIFCETVGA